MEYWLYIFTSFAALSYIFFKKRNFDLFTILIICSFYYSSPLLLGVLYDPDKHSIINVSSKIYWFYSSFFCASILGAYKFDKGNIFLFRGKIFNHSALQFYLFITCIIFLMLVMIDSSIFFQKEVGEKSVTQFGPLWAAFAASTLILLSLSIIVSNNYFFVIASIFLLMTLIAGSRAYFAAGAIIYALGTYKYSPPFVIATKFSLLFKILLGFFFLFLWKIAYPFVLVGQYTQALQSIVDPVGIGFRLFRGSEAGLVMLNFHHAIELFEYSSGSILELMVVKLIPFLHSEFATVFELNGSTFSDILNIKYYQTVNYGMASNLWGSIYYVSGPLGLLLFLAFFIWLVTTLNKLIKLNNLWSHHLVGPSAFLCFYGTRLEVGSLAYFFYVNITMLVFFRIMVSLLKHKKHYKPNITYGSTKLSLK